MERHIEVAEKIIDGVRGLAGPTVGAALARIARGDADGASEAVLRLAWLSLIREAAAQPAGLVTGLMSVELLSGGAQPFEEYLDDRRVFCEGQPTYVDDPNIFDSMRWSANYLHGILEAPRDDLLALVMIPRNTIAQRDAPVLPAAVDPRVLSWLEGEFEPESAAEHLALARVVETADPERARALLEDAAELEAPSAELLYELGRVQMRERAWEAAEKTLAQCRAVSAEISWELEYDSAQVALKLGNGEEALAGYDRVLALVPESIDARFQRSAALSQLSRHPDALAELQQIIALTPDDPEAFFNRGITHGRLERLDEALADYDKTLELRPSHVGAWNNRGLLKRDRGDVEGAIADLSSALQVGGSNPTVLINRAELLERAGKRDEAIADWSSIIAEQPSLPAFDTRSRLFLETDLRWRAISDAVTVLRASTEPNDYVTSALERLKQLGYDAALTVHPVPVDPSVLVEEGTQLEASGDAEAAAKNYERALEIDPGFVDALYNLGNLKLASDQHDVAISLYSRALEVTPNDVQARLNRGTALLHLGMRDGIGELLAQAAGDFQHAMAIDPQHPKGYLKLGMMELLEGRSWNALVLLLVARSLLGESPEGPMVEQQISEMVLPAIDLADRASGREAAVGVLRALVARRVLNPVAFAAEQLLATALPEEPAVLSMLAMVYWLAEQDDRAGEYASRALEASPEETGAFFQTAVDGGVVPRQVLDLLEQGDDDD